MDHIERENGKVWLVHDKPAKSETFPQLKSVEGADNADKAIVDAYETYQSTDQSIIFSPSVDRAINEKTEKYRQELIAQTWASLEAVTSTPPQPTATPQKTHEPKMFTSIKKKTWIKWGALGGSVFLLFFVLTLVLRGVNV